MGKQHRTAVPVEGAEQAAPTRMDPVQLLREVIEDLEDAPEELEGRLLEALERGAGSRGSRIRSVIEEVTRD